MHSTSLTGLRAPAWFLVFLLAAMAPAHAIHAHRGPTSHSPQRLKKSSHGKKGPTGQRQIDPARAAQIQAALVKAGYLTGTPSGQMDAQTNAALAKLQGDNGWQTKITPDSRALIKLGLGPQSDSAASAAPAAVPSAAAAPASSGTLSADNAANRSSQAN